MNQTLYSKILGTRLFEIRKSGDRYGYYVDGKKVTRKVFDQESFRSCLKPAA